MPDQQRRTRRQFTPEFKHDAVEPVRTTGRPVAEIARELGIYDSTASRARCRSQTLLPSRSHGNSAVMAALLHQPDL
jgi:transposase-like protein